MKSATRTALIAMPFPGRWQVELLRTITGAQPIAPGARSVSQVLSLRSASGRSARPSRVYRPHDRHDWEAPELRVLDSPIHVASERQASRLQWRLAKHDRSNDRLVRRIRSPERNCFSGVLLPPKTTVDLIPRAASARRSEPPSGWSSRIAPSAVQRPQRGTPRALTTAGRRNWKSRVVFRRACATTRPTIRESPNGDVAAVPSKP